MKVLLHTFLCFLVAISVSANSITGYVSDDEESLYGATVVVLEKSDSTMVAFGLTDEVGKFLIHDIPDGDFLLQVSYTGYQDSYTSFSTNSENSSLYLGRIVLSVSSAVLQEVSIEAERIPMGILGDTINYNAAAFKTRAGASVEELLKKMPGIEVARDGSIKAQGEDVENVLVDGKEFFSGDPTMATKNLEAAAVDKVQVFDKKSEEAEFTGVDDGQDEKTINLKLKEEYKHGGFGKLTAEGGTEETHLAKVNYNRFSPSVQASLIGNLNNVNEQAFSFNDYIQFMGGLNNVLSNGGFRGNSLFGGGENTPKGIRDQKALGTNLNWDVSSKLETNFNYLYSGQLNTLNQVNQAINFTDNQIFTSQDTVNVDANNTNHSASLKMDYKLNPRNIITIKSNATFGFEDNSELAMTDFLQDGFVESNTTNNQVGSIENSNVGGEMKYMRKFAVKGRSWISNAKYSKANQEENLNIDNKVFSGSILNRVVQLQNLEGVSADYSFSSKFKEPIRKGLYLGLHYSFGNNNQNPNRRFYNFVNAELLLDQVLSDDFTRSWKTHSTGLSLRRNRKKMKITSQLSYLNTNLETFQKRDDVLIATPNSYLLPSVSFDWDLKGLKRLELNYSTNVNAPTIDQIITIPNNANPNYIVLGNPELTPEYMHTIGTNYSSFDQFNFSNLFSTFRLSMSPNKIVNSTDIKSDFTTEILPVNATGYISGQVYISHSRPIRPLKVKYNVNTSFLSERYNTLLNGVENEISTLNLDMDIRIENRKNEKLDIAGGFKFNMNDYQSSFNSSSNFSTYSWYTDLDWDITSALHFRATYDFRTFDASFAGENEVQHLVNLSLRQSFFDDRFGVELSVHDLLNENTGISRFGTQTSLVDTRYNTLMRYFTLGMTYKLGKVKAAAITFEE